MKMQRQKSQQFTMRIKGDTVTVVSLWNCAIARFL